MPFQFPLPNLSSGFIDLLIYNNTVTNGWFSVLGILVPVFMIAFLSLVSRGFAVEKAFTGSVFSATLLSYIMILIPGFLSPEIIVAMTMLTAVSIILLYKTGRGNY